MYLKEKNKKTNGDWEVDRYEAQMSGAPDCMRREVSSADVSVAGQLDRLFLVGVWAGKHPADESDIVMT